MDKTFKYRQLAIKDDKIIYNDVIERKWISHQAFLLDLIKWNTMPQTDNIIWFYGPVESDI